jgi:hypothetical protein
MPTDRVVAHNAGPPPGGPRAGALRPEPPGQAEQLFLNLLNYARSNPAAYGRDVGLDLTAIHPAQPLVLDRRLVTAARYHSRDMAVRRYFDHATPDGVNPGHRMLDAGLDWSGWGQSLAAGYDTPAEALRALIADDGVEDLGHRRHLLGQGEFAAHSLCGVGVWSGEGPHRHYYTIDTAAPSQPSRDPEAGGKAVRRLYALYLGREPAADEVAEVAPLLADGESFRQAAVRALAAPEARSRRFESWFRTHLGRGPKEGEHDYLLHAAAHGVPDEHALAWVLALPDFARAAGLGEDPDPDALATALYQALLGREPSPEERGRVALSLATKPTGWVALEIMRTAEYRRQTAREVCAALGVDPDACGADSWVGRGGSDLHLHAAALQASLAS